MLSNWPSTIPEPMDDTTCQARAAPINSLGCQRQLRAPSHRDAPSLGELSASPATRPPLAPMVKPFNPFMPGWLEPMGLRGAIQRAGPGAQAGIAVGS